MPGVCPLVGRERSEMMRTDVEVSREARFRHESESTSAPARG